MKVKPYGHRVIVEMEKSKNEFKGIALPDANEVGLTDVSVVLELGISNKPYPVEIGNKVIVGSTGATQILFNDKDAYIVDVENILAILAD
jgi:co-chaperonin GroES (HSP10)